MLVLLDTSHDLTACSEEIGAEVEQLLTPLTRFRLQRPASRFAIDNGAFAKFNAKSFMSLLERERERQAQCIFVAAPDVVGSAQRTLELFGRWGPLLKDSGWPVALVCQDGQDHLPIPWGDLDAVFIGGSTAFKESDAVAQIILAAKIHWQKWVHVGRVNTPGRFDHFEKLGADSIDGTGLSRYSWMRERIYAAYQEPPLFADVA